MRWSLQFRDSVGDYSESDQGRSAGHGVLHGGFEQGLKVVRDSLVVWRYGEQRLVELAHLLGVSEILDRCLGALGVNAVDEQDAIFFLLVGKHEDEGVVTGVSWLVTGSNSGR